MSKINNKNSTIKRVLLQIRPYLPTIILLLALAVVSVLCSLYIPVLVGDAIDAIIGKEQVNFAVILPKLFTCAVLIGCAALAQWLMNVCGNKVTYNTIMLTLPPMLILDEATSSIDTRTELRIQRAFLKLMRGRTSFVVAHRLSTIKESDVILVMRDGNIVEQGDHESLLAKNGFYAELYRSQFTDEEQPVG